MSLHPVDARRYSNGGDHAAIMGSVVGELWQPLYLEKQPPRGTLWLRRVFLLMSADFGSPGNRALALEDQRLTCISGQDCI